MSENENSAPIQSVERAAKVMELFVHGRTDLDLSDITGLTGFSRATAHRYCVSLRAVGFLRYNPSSGTYGLGARMIEYGAVAREGLPLAATADPYIYELVAAIDRTVVMTVWDGHAPVIVRVNDNTSTNIRISVRVGVRLPLFESAQGLIYLSFSERIRHRFEGRSELEAIESTLDQVRRNGVCMRSLSPGLRVIGAPIFRSGEVPGTLALIGTEGTIPQDVGNHMVSQLKDTSKKLSRDLTARG